MRGMRRLAPSPAMAVAFAALCVALAGTATALPGRNSVKKDDIASNAVLSKHIKKGNVRGADVGNDALTGTNIKESSLAKVPAAAAADAAAISKVTYKSATFSVPPTGLATHGSVGCDPNTRVLGGGVKSDDPNNVFILTSYPNSSVGWETDVANTGIAAINATVFAICGPAAAIG